MQEVVAEMEGGDSKLNLGPTQGRWIAAQAGANQSRPCSSHGELECRPRRMRNSN